jgi:hypothetical protein
MPFVQVVEQLSMEAVIPWRGRLRMQTNNPGKHLGYIGNLDIYSDEGKRLQETIVSVLEPYLDQNYHVY